MSLSPGVVFAGYTVVRALGAGGMGEVYLVEHPRLPRQEALKILSAAVSSDPSFQARFMQEADLAAALSHPSIVRVNDRGEAGGRLWLSMDYVDGTDAAQLQRERYPAGMPAAEVGVIISAVADALDYAHDQGLVHRDVKPANILLSQLSSDGTRRVFLADFGIARELANPNGLTETNLTVGTVAYASPEQLMGADVDGRSDQYALAATAFQLLTGVPPYQNSNPVAVIGQHLNAAIPDLSAHRPDLAALDKVLARGLAKNPQDRYARCADFAGELAAHSGAGAGGGEATQLAIRPAAPPAPPRTTRGPDKRSLKIGAAALVAVLAAGGAGYAFTRHIHGGQAAPGTDAASQAAPEIPASLLEGIYRLEYPFAASTVMGAPVDPPGPGEPTIGERWWAFRSDCGGGICVATATKLNDTDHLSATQPPVTGVLRFVDGRWVSDPEKFRLSNERCTVDSAGVEVSGFNSAVEQWSLEPQTDTTLRGAITVTDTSSECGTEGRVYVQYPTLSRIGDAPAGVPIADPKTVPALPPPVPLQPAPGGVFDGMYRVDVEYTKTTIENGKLATSSADGAEWWAFRSACSDSGCVATGALLDDSNHQEAAGSATVLQLTNGRWEDAGGHPMLISCQWGRGGENVVKSSWFFQQNPDGAVTGERTLSVTTNGCGDAGLVSRTPLRADRVGDVPTSVILADPGLFLS